MKRKYSTFIIYMIILVLLVLVPWIPVGNKEYCVIQFLTILKEKGIDLLARKYCEIDSVTQVQAIIKIQMPILYVQILVLIMTVICALFGKKCYVKYINVIIVPINAIFQFSGYYLTSFGSITILSVVVPALIAALSILEIPISIFCENWASAKKEWERHKKIEQEQKREQKERLEFEGKYTSQMYTIVMKNFIGNWKDYILLLISSIIVFECYAVGFGIQQILNEGYEQQGAWIFNTLDGIVMNAFLPISILGIFVMIHLITYNIQCQTKNYGIFLTLGMRRKTLYKFIASEYLVIIIISLVVGGILENIIIYSIMFETTIFESTGPEILKVTIFSCMKALGMLSAIIVASNVICFDILRDFKAGKSTDQRLVGESLPNKFRRIGIVVGILLVMYTTIQYGRRINFENINLLLVLFVGIFVILRYVIAELLIKEKKEGKRIGKLLQHSQLFHKSRTSIVYIGVILIMMFGTLYYFDFQLVATELAMTETDLFPYDAVCLVDDEDDKFLRQLTQEYEVKITEVPALRVTTYDSTKENDGTSRPIQGQHIGISESTYHELKKQLDPAYKQKELGLMKDEDVYIVYQQDKSIEAHPIGYFSPKKSPLLHIGIPCSGVDIYSKQEGYYEYYTVKGEEVNSLIGAFSRGERENIVVFSDGYFEKAKNFWKDCNIINGKKIEEKEMAIPGITTFQGITKMALMEIPEDNMEKVERLLDDFEQQCVKEEQELFANYKGTPMQGVYDLSVSHCYLKEQAEKNLKREHFLEIEVDKIAIIVMELMLIMLVLVKMLTELDTNRGRAKFLSYIGMRKRERIKLLKIENYNYFLLIPLGISTLLSTLYVIMIWKARMYTKEDIHFFVLHLLPLWMMFIVTITLAFILIINIFSSEIEKVNS